MKSKTVAVLAIGVIVVGTLLLLRQVNEPANQIFSNVEETYLSDSDGTAQPNQTDVERFSTTGPNSDPDLTNQIASTIANAPSSPGSDNVAATTSVAATLRSNPTATPIPTGVTPNLTEGVIGGSPTLPGRLAPDVLVDPLQFQNIRIFKNVESGVFSGRADVKNTGATYLNQLVISWKILNGTRQVLDQGQFNWPNLAPNETATMAFDGTALFVDTWAQIEFSYPP